MFYIVKRFARNHESAGQPGWIKNPGVRGLRVSQEPIYPSMLWCIVLRILAGLVPVAHGKCAPHGADEADAASKAVD